MSKPRKYSQLQLSVFRFYRETLKFASAKQEPTKTSLINFIKGEFHQNATIPRRNFQSIEHHMRIGKNKFKMIKEFDCLDGISFMSSHQKQ